ncbi:MAG: ATP-dependent DNA helicase, partial [Actinocatenispora sp.]
MSDGSARASEIAIEQRHVDRVYARLETLRAETAESTRRGFGLAGVGNFGALVERDAMVYQLSRRLRALDAEYDGLVFGRLDLAARTAGSDGAAEGTSDDATAGGSAGAAGN